MTDHRVPGVRNQRGPNGTCRERACGRSVHWDVLADQWVHNYSVAEAAARTEQMTRDLVAMMTGLAGSLPIARALGDTPERVEAYLVSGRKLA